MRSQPRALSAEEQTEVRQVLYSERFVDQSPYEVYAGLLDAGRYLCSVRSMYRFLAADAATGERRNQLRHPQYQQPELLATGPNQVWSWDITKLLGPKKWTYYQLYVILDIYSRYAVGWMLAHRESHDLASRLIRETITKQNADASALTIHSDRGPSMTSQNVAQLLASLGVTKSHSRPHVSNDNPFSESQFKTLKYRPEFPERFESFDAALSFCREFFAWYNDEHYHSGIDLLTPSSLHYGRAQQVLDHRHQVMQAAYARHPDRFVKGCPRPKQVPSAVWINPPAASPISEKNGLRALECTSKPQASLTHPRLGYPSSSCVPAELDSVSPSANQINKSQTFDQGIEHPSHASKIPGGWGLAPIHEKIASEASPSVL
jgi:putative transposase